MSTKIRKQIYLEREQDLKLKELSAATGLSEADIIRRTLDRGLSTISEERAEFSAWLDELHFIREWVSQGPVEGSRKWTRDELHDR